MQWLVMIIPLTFLVSVLHSAYIDHICLDFETVVRKIYNRVC